MRIALFAFAFANLVASAHAQESISSSKIYRSQSSPAATRDAKVNGYRSPTHAFGKSTNLPNYGVRTGKSTDMGAQSNITQAAPPTTTTLNSVSCSGGRSWTGSSCACPASYAWNGMSCSASLANALGVSPSTAVNRGSSGDIVTSASPGTADASYAGTADFCTSAFCGITILSGNGYGDGQALVIGGPYAGSLMSTESAFAFKNSYDEARSAYEAAASVATTMLDSTNVQAFMSENNWSQDDFVNWSAAGGVIPYQ